MLQKEYPNSHYRVWLNQTEPFTIFHYGIRNNRTNRLQCKEIPPASGPDTGEACRVVRTTSQLHQRNRNISVTSLMKIAKALNVQPLDLIDEEHLKTF